MVPLCVFYFRMLVDKAVIYLGRGGKREGGLYHLIITWSMRNILLHTSSLSLPPSLPPSLFPFLPLLSPSLPSSLPPQTSQSKEISLAQFVCSEVNISYAVVMSGDSISQYSPSQTICVFIPQGKVHDCALLYVVTYTHLSVFPYYI